MVTPEEMRRSALEAIEEERRREWRSTRTPFQRRGWAQTFPLSTSVTTVQIASASGADLERIKRLQVKLLLPKGARSGFLGVIREPKGETINLAGVDFGSPLVLRPIQFLGNVDHATYWDFYLPAINLADAGKLYLVSQVTVGSAEPDALVALRYVHERGLEG